MGEDGRARKRQKGYGPHPPRDARGGRRVPRCGNRRYRRAMTDLAIYDMDRTITRSPTYSGFLWHAARRIAPWRMLFAPALLGPLALYGLRLIGRARLKEWSQRILLGSHLPPVRLVPVAESFAAHTLATNLLPGARAQIAEDRRAGRRLVLATASYRLYAEAIGRAAGFDDVIATNSLARAKDGAIRAKIEGENCYGPAKLRMVEAWMAAEGLAREDARIRFYTDHVSDAPVLEWADEPFAVNPSPRLRRLAEERGWPLLDWR